MPSFSGAFSGKASSQTVVYVNDVPEHELHVNEINGAQKSTDKGWNNAKRRELGRHLEIFWRDRQTQGSHGWRQLQRSANLSDAG
jgi:hypothetical protein